MRNLWNGTYKQPPYWKKQAERLVELAQLPTGASVLDAGSGSGGTLIPAAKCVGPSGRVVGIDVDKECVQTTRRRIYELGLSHAEAIQMDARSMSFPDESFDVVLAGMLAFDEDYDFEKGKVIGGAATLHEIRRVLKPGGFLRHSNWHWQEDSEWMRELLSCHLPDCQKRGYWPGTEEGYVDLLHQVGFEEIRVVCEDHRFTYEDAADWLAAIRHVWQSELSRIQELASDRRQAFEEDAMHLLGPHYHEGKLAFTRSFLFVSAQKPISDTRGARTLRSH